MSTRDNISEIIDQSDNGLQFYGDDVTRSIMPPNMYTYVGR